MAGGCHSSIVMSDPLWYNDTMKLFKWLWNLIIHVFWSVFFYGELLKSFDGLLMLFNTRISIAYATWNDGLMFSILIGFWVLAISLSRWMVAYFRDLAKKSSNPVDKT
jgi:hypothetical protein